jgi:hypothetical protein
MLKYKSLSRHTVEKVLLGEYSFEFKTHKYLIRSQKGEIIFFFKGKKGKYLETREGLVHTTSRKYLFTSSIAEKPDTHMKSVRAR